MSTPVTLEGLKKELPANIRKLGWGLLLAGIAATALGYAVDPRQMAFDNVIGYLFLTSVAVGSVFLVALEYIGGATPGVEAAQPEK